MNYLSESYITPPRRGWPLPADTGYESDELYTAMAADPGGTTGWALFGIFPEAMRSDEFSILENVAFWSAGEFSGPETGQVDSLVDMALAWPRARLIFEDFILRQMAGGRDLLAPVRVTSRFEGALHERIDRECRAIVKQQPALAMTTMTDERLDMVGALKVLKGQPHARDAVRHAITYVRRHKRILRINAVGEPE